jgi:hypothetical protein
MCYSFRNNAWDYQLVYTTQMLNLRFKLGYVGGLVLAKKKPNQPSYTQCKTLFLWFNSMAHIRSDRCRVVRTEFLFWKGKRHWPNTGLHICRGIRVWSAGRQQTKKFGAIAQALRPLLQIIRRRMMKKKGARPSTLSLFKLYVSIYIAKFYSLWVRWD